MAVRCFNRNDPAYKNLVNVLDSPLVTDSLIEGYQSLHKLSEDVFPTVPEALEYVDMKAVSFSLKQRTFGKALFGNLSRNKWVYKLKDKYYVNTIAGAGYMGIEDSKKAVRNNIKRIERYLDYNNISSEALEFIPTKNWKKKSNGTYEIKIKTGLFTKQDVLKKSRGTDTTHTTKIINHLGKMFPEVKIRIATLEEAEEHYNGLPEWQKKDLPFEEVKSYFVNNEVVLIKERITTETAIEEVLHPFIDAVHVDNQPLFKGLLSEAKKNFPILNQQIQDSYSDLKGFDKTDRELELVTQALSRHFKKEYEGTPTLTWKQKVIELLNWLKRIINDLHIYITGKGIPVSAIRSTYAEPISTIKEEEKKRSWSEEIKREGLFSGPYWDKLYNISRDSAAYKKASKTLFGIDVVFKQTPELSKIGTEEQYSAWIDYILTEGKFKGTEVKNIMWHKTSAVDWKSGVPKLAFEEFIGKSRYGGESYRNAIFFTSQKDDMSIGDINEQIAFPVLIDTTAPFYVRQDYGMDEMHNLSTQQDQETGVYEFGDYYKLDKLKGQLAGEQYDSVIIGSEGGAFEKGGEVQYDLSLIDFSPLRRVYKKAMAEDPKVRARVEESIKKRTAKAVEYFTAFNKSKNPNKELNDETREFLMENKHFLPIETVYRPTGIIDVTTTVHPYWVMVGDPKNIHKLGDREDIQGFKEFVGEDKQVSTTKLKKLPDSNTLLIDVTKDIQVSSEVEEVAQREGYDLKKERHITVIGFPIKRKIEEVLKNLSKEDRVRVEEEIDNLVAKTNFTYNLLDEHYFITKEYKAASWVDPTTGETKSKPASTRKAIIQKVDMPVIQGFYSELGNILDTTFDKPFPHITLATQGDPMGIGINSVKEFNSLNPVAATFKAIRQPGTTFSDSPGFGPPIKTSTTLSDVAKLLNTEGLSFKLENKVKDSRVRYHLSKEKQDTLNYAFAGGNDIQKKMGARMFHLSQISTKEIDSLTVSLSDDSGNNPLVEMDEDHRYFDKSTQEGKPIEYTSTTLAIKGEFKDKEDKKLNLDLGNDFDIIAESIAMGKTFDDIKDRMVVLDEILGERAYANLMGTIMTLKAQHYVILPQVIFFDPVVKIAGTADLVVISPDGKLGIIDIKSGKAPVGSAAYDTDPYSLSEGSILGAKWKEKHEGQELKLSTKEQYGVQIGVYRRMAENMGYELMDSDILGAYAAFHFNVDIKGRGKQQEFEKFRYGEWVRYEDSQNDLYINMLVPSDINQEAYDAVQAEFAEVGEDDFINSENYFTGDEGLPEDVESGSQFDVIYERLDSYNLGLINHTELIEKLRLDIFTDRSKKEILDGISKTSTAIVNSFTGGFEKVSEIYTDVLLNSIKEIKSFREYVKNPDNIKKPEYITHVLNFSTFAESYRGLHTVGKTAELGKYQMKLVNELTYQLNLVVGEPDRTNELGVIDQAIYDYVEALVKGTTTRKNWSDEEVKQMLHKVRDMDVMEYYTYDTAGATDPLLQIMDKLKKRAQLEVMDKVEERNEAIRGPAIKLRKLSKGNKVDYSFAMQIGADGKWNGQYTQELGYDYHKMKQDVYDGIYDEEGQPLVYVDINDLANARPEDIAHNKKVKKAKEKMNAFFMAEERGTSGKPIDGEYHKYTKEFKDERAKYEEWIDTGDWGHWRRRPGVHTDYAWLSYRARWYESKKTYIGSYDSNDNFTGQVTLTSKSYPKVKARIARTVTRPSKEYPKGRDMTDPKWRKIMSPTTTLEEAQKEWFLMFKKHYEEDLLKKLPQGVRGNTLGKAPLVFNNLGDRLKTKGPLITSLWANMTKGVKDWWSTTGSSKAVMTDSFGNFIDTVPVYYVGNPRSDKALKSIDKKIAALDKDYGLGKIKLGVFENDKQALKNRRAKIMAMPTTEEISTDLTDSLLRFSAMAENYEMMSAIEDTLKSIVKVIEKREYTPSGGTKLFGKVEGVAREIGMRGTGTQGEALTVRRAKEFMHLQFYDNKEKTRNWWDKTVSGLIRYSSLSYVAFNPFGNLNNFTIGVINNSIELAGQRFFKRKSYARASKEFYNRALQDIVRATAYSYSSKAYDKYRPQSKYEAMVAYLRMMDKKMDIRELEGLQGKESWLARKMNFGYVINDAAEYNVQTRIGVTLLIDQMIKNSKTGATLSLYDAYTHHGNGDVTMKEGFDMLIDDEGNDIKSWNEGVARYDMRIKIREVNKQIHGNYAKEDRMVIQQYTLGKLGAQFHKWVIPAIKARYRREYFDENLGWLEGRYLSAFNFLHYALKHMGEIGKWTTNYKEQIKDPERATMKMKNVWRTAMEFQFFATTWLMSLLLANLFEDDDDQSETIKRLENVAIYTFGRAQDEMVVFAPWMPPFEGAEVMYQMFKSPIASTRTMGELAEAFDSTLTWGWGNFLLASGQITRGEFRTNKDLVYQRGIYEGRLKVAKQWADAVPILYGIQRWASFKNQKDFHIK